MFNIAKKLGWETFLDSVKFTWDSTFVDALGPRDPIEIKPKSKTAGPLMYPIFHEKLTLYVHNDWFLFCHQKDNHLNSEEVCQLAIASPQQIQ